MKAPHSVLLLTCICLISVSATAQSKKISPKPEPGLWRSERIMMINGVDLEEVARKIGEDNIRRAPPELRKEMADIIGDPQLECISKEEALIMTSPKELLARENFEVGHCEYKVQETSERKFSFTGRCHASNGAALGDVKGEMEMINEWKLRSNMYSLEGFLMEVQLGDTTELVKADIAFTEVATWVSADCGDADPRWEPSEPWED